jgi:hypothetical protein
MSNFAGSQVISQASLCTSRQKTVSEVGWLSHATYLALPPRFQRAACELASKGELVIEDMPMVTEGA